MSIPVALNVRGKQIYIVGGGAVALRKAHQFVQEGAHVIVIACDVDERFSQVQGIAILHHAFSWDLVDEDCFYLYATTNDEKLNTQLKLEANKRHILFGCSMYMENCDVYSMFSNSTEELQIALSTKGNCAGADRTLYEQYFEPQLSTMNVLVFYLRNVRAALLERHVSSLIIKAVIKTLAELDVSYTKHILDCLEGKQVILLAYHGIADVKQEAAALKQMQTLVESAFPQYTCMSVFTSDKIMKKAKQKGTHIASIMQIITLLESLGISYIIQPMMLQHGEIYHELISICKTNLIGTPLWDTKEELMQTYHMLKETYDLPLLGLYHPSHSISKDILFDSDLFLSFDQVNIKQVTQKQAMVIPLVVLYGYHAKKDIEQRWMPALWKQGIDAALINTGLLSNQEIQYQFLRHIKQLIKQTS